MPKGYDVRVLGAVLCDILVGTHHALVSDMPTTHTNTRTNTNSSVSRKRRPSQDITLAIWIISLATPVDASKPLDAASFGKVSV